MVNLCDRFPNIGGVAVITNICRVDVVEAFTGGNNTIMTGHTRLSNLFVIKVRRCPCGAAVTVITLSHSGQMIGIFTLGNNTIVATVTRAQYLQMIDLGCGFPRISGVAVLTDIGSTDVFETLAGGDDAVMAGCTGLGCLLVIKLGGYPGCRRVAVITLRRGWQVIEIFTGADDAIMAGITTSKYL